VTVIFSGSVAGGVAGNTAFLAFPSEAKCRAAAGVMEASERVAISATRPGRTNISPPAYYRIIARRIERTGTRPAGHGRLPQNMNRSFGERTGPFRSAIPIDPDQWFRLIPITHSGRSRSVCGEV
jgi:hypothetical protein